MSSTLPTKRSGPPPPMKAWAPSNHLATEGMQDATRGLGSILSQHQDYRTTSGGTPRANSQQQPHRPASPRVRNAMMGAAQDVLLERVAQDAEDRIQSMAEAHRREMDAAAEATADLQKRFARKEMEARIAQSQLEAVQNAAEEMEEESSVLQGQVAGLEATIETLRARYLEIAAKWETKERGAASPAAPQVITGQGDAVVQLSDLFQWRVETAQRLAEEADDDIAVGPVGTDVAARRRAESMQELRFRVHAVQMGLEEVSGVANDEERRQSVLLRQSTSLKEEAAEIRDENTRLKKALQRAQDNQSHDSAALLADRDAAIELLSARMKAAINAKAAAEERLKGAADTEQQVADLQEKVKSLTSQLQQAESATTAAAAKADEALTSKVADLQEKVKSLTSQLQKAESATTAAAAKADEALTSKVADHQEKVKSLTSQLQQAESATTAAGAKLTLAEDKITALATQAHGAELAKTSSQATVVRLEEEVERLSAQVLSLTDEAGTAALHATTLQSTLKIQAGELQQTSSLHDEIQSLTAQLHAESEKAQAVTKLTSAQTSQISSLQDEIKSLQKQLVAESAKTAAQVNIQEAEASLVSSLHDEVKALTSQLQGAEAAKATALANQKTAEAALSEVKAAELKRGMASPKPSPKGSPKTDDSKLQAELNQLRSEKCELAVQLDTVRGTNESIDADNKSLRAQLAAAPAKRDDADNAMRKTNDRLTADVVALTSRLQSIEVVKEQVTAQLQSAERACSDNASLLGEVDALQSQLRDCQKDAEEASTALMADIEQLRKELAVEKEGKTTVTAFEWNPSDAAPFEHVALMHSMAEALKECDAGKDQTLELAAVCQLSLQEGIDAATRLSAIEKKLKASEAEVEFRKSRVTEAKTQLAEKNKAFNVLEERMAEVGLLLRQNSIAPPAWIGQYKQYTKKKKKLTTLTETHNKVFSLWW